jgi:hypothetical protein
MREDTSIEERDVGRLKVVVGRIKTYRSRFAVIQINWLAFFCATTCLRACFPLSSLWKRLPCIEGVVATL